MGKKSELGRREGGTGFARVWLYFVRAVGATDHRLNARMRTHDLGQRICAHRCPKNRLNGRNSKYLERLGMRGGFPRFGKYRALQRDSRSGGDATKRQKESNARRKDQGDGSMGIETFRVGARRFGC